MYALMPHILPTYNWFTYSNKRDLGGLASLVGRAQLLSLLEHRLEEIHDV